MKVLFINNNGGGFADYIEVEPATTVEVLFQDASRTARQRTI